MQTDLLNWIDQTTALRPSEAIQHRAFVIEQLQPVIDTLEALELSPSAIADALAYHQGQLRQKAQKEVIKG